MGVRLEGKVTGVNQVDPFLSLAQPAWVSFIHLHLGFISLLSKGELLLASHILYLGSAFWQLCILGHVCLSLCPR